MPRYGRIRCVRREGAQYASVLRASQPEIQDKDATVSETTRSIERFKGQQQTGPRFLCSVFTDDLLLRCAAHSGIA